MKGINRFLIALPLANPGAQVLSFPTMEPQGCRTPIRG
jgi:hypothetical protein